jgi:hypothetical protein
LLDGNAQNGEVRTIATLTLRLTIKGQL